MKKIKKISIRISLDDYTFLKKYYGYAKGLGKYYTKSFSEYLRHLLILGLENI